jgi:DnaD/phage-associated family protein
MMNPPVTNDTAPQRTFAGFPAGARATAVPSAFFSELLPLIEDPDELRVTLYVIYALGRRKGYPRFVTLRELRAEAPLLASLGDAGDEAALARLEHGLAGAFERGGLLRLDVDVAGRSGPETLVFLNAPADRRALERISRGQVDLGRALPHESGSPVVQPDNVFQLYEANIGPLTPLVAEELQEAERLYPFEWLEEALKEAALQNKRSWRYAAAILRRWATEGRKRETPGRDPGEGNSARAQFLRRYRDLGGE